MVGRAGIAENRPMSQIAVRCHPYAPVAAESLQKWLREEVKRLRKSAPGASIRLLRLSQPGPAEEIEVGWQIEIGGSLTESPLDEESLAELLRDLRLLGLQPSVLGEQGTLDCDPEPERLGLMPELDPGGSERAQAAPPRENGTLERDPEAGRRRRRSLMPEPDPGTSERRPMRRSSWT